MIAALVTAVAPAQAQPIGGTVLEPPTRGEPAEVYFDVSGVEVVGIDEAQEIFEMEARIYAFWQDARLAHASEVPKRYQGAAAEEALKSEIWWPYFELTDAREPREVMYVAVDVDQDGWVTYRERFRAVIKQPFDLVEFPFDSQDISFTFEPFAFSGEFVQFVQCDSDAGQQCEDLVSWEPVEWVVGSSVLDVEPGSQDSFARATVRMEIERVGRGYVENIILPLILIVMISSAVFWMNLERIHLGERLGVSFTSVLTVVAFDFVASDKLPNLWYPTRVDTVLTLAYVFLTINILENVLVSRQHERGREKRAAAIDRLFRWAYPPVFILAVFVAMVRELPPLYE